MSFLLSKVVMKAVFPTFKVVSTFLIWARLFLYFSYIKLYGQFCGNLNVLLWFHMVLVPLLVPIFSHTLCISASALLCRSFVSTDLSILLNDEDYEGFSSWCVEASQNSEKVNGFKDITTKWKNKVQGHPYCTTLVNLLHDPFGVVYFDKINGPSNIQIFHCCFSLMY